MIILLLSFTGIVVAQNYVTVKTSYGIVQGRTVDYGNDRSQLYYGRADIFLGVPYARAPIGDLRFKRAVDCAPYNQIYDATYYRPKCPQLYAGDYVNEDCLYLNIFTPKAGAQPGAAVMVFIDGANGFGQGGWDSTTQKGMVRNLVSRGVVCVTLQYRLGALERQGVPLRLHFRGRSQVKEFRTLYGFEDKACTIVLDYMLTIGKLAS
ncbi:unnamed protein product [Cylicocyclus nassatus]|uniref:Carboxylesterase type B domain-containing protein n=1 Tax=Cylicocyclus nassatus TaxID=53992 RepID=A0AA36M720_CYLNA|nr:unnamed protein product [Cylicocyclus nassatus]